MSATTGSKPRDSGHIYLEYDDIKKGLSNMAQSTAIPTTPNTPLNPPPVAELQNISPITIQQAFDNQTQGNLKKAPNATNNLNLDLTTYNDQDYKNLKDLVLDDSITRKDFAGILVDLSDNYITANQLDYNKNATKEEMWNIFSKKIDVIKNSLFQKIQDAKNKNKTPNEIYNELSNRYEDLIKIYKIATDKDKKNESQKLLKVLKYNYPEFSGINGRATGDKIVSNIHTIILKILVDNGQLIGITKKEVKTQINDIRNKHNINPLKNK